MNLPLQCASSPIVSPVTSQRRLVGPGPEMDMVPEHPKVAAFLQIVHKCRYQVVASTMTARLDMRTFESALECHLSLLEAFKAVRRGETKAQT